MPHDRDDSFERLLREALAPRSASSVAGPCFDAETAAAWADDTLAVSERSAAEEHAAHCPRCRALLAALATTAPAAPSTPRRRFGSAAWLVPLTAALAGALVWGVMPRIERMAEPRQQSATPIDSVASRLSERAAAGLEDEKRLDADRLVSSGTSAQAAQVGSPRTRREKTSDKSKEPAAIVPSVTPPVSAQASAAADSVTRSERGTGSVSKDQASAGPASVTAPTLAETVIVGGVTGGVAGRAEASPPPTKPQEAATVSGAAPLSAVGTATARASGAAREGAVSVANSPMMWRIGPGGTVQRSADGGSSWQTERPDERWASVKLTALSAPSPTVGWLVGARGTVFRLVDGRTWRRVAFPEPVDLIAVRATDESTATVTALDGRVFITSDRGATWVRTRAR